MVLFLGACSYNAVIVIVTHTITTQKLEKRHTMLIQFICFCLFVIAFKSKNIVKMMFHCKICAEKEEGMGPENEWLCLKCKNKKLIEKQ